MHLPPIPTIPRLSCLLDPGAAAGGVFEVVVHGLPGFQNEVGDTDAMARCALDILLDAEKARAMGARGRARAHELFAEEKIVDQYEQLYRDCLTRRHESV